MNFKTAFLQKKLMGVYRHAFYRRMGRHSSTLRHVNSLQCAPTFHHWCYKSHVSLCIRRTVSYTCRVVPMPFMRWSLIGSYNNHAKSNVANKHIYSTVPTWLIFSLITLCMYLAKRGFSYTTIYSVQCSSL